LCLARPCTTKGTFLEDPLPEPELAQAPNTIPDNPWSPFPDRLAFDWAQYHYVCLQSSEDEIHEGLDLWHATVIKHKAKHNPHDSVPWQNVKDLYKTLDSIMASGIGWKTFKFCYMGSKPLTPPQWMDKIYKLNVWDVLDVLEQQISTTKFNSQFKTTPYEEYDNTGQCIFSNLMSGYWATCEVVRLSFLIR